MNLDETTFVRQYLCILLFHITTPFTNSNNTLSTLLNLHSLSSIFSFFFFLYSLSSLLVLILWICTRAPISRSICDKRKTTTAPLPLLITYHQLHHVTISEEIVVDGPFGLGEVVYEVHYILQLLCLWYKKTRSNHRCRTLPSPVLRQYDT